MPACHERKEVLEDIFYASESSCGTVSNFVYWVEAFILTFYSLSRYDILILCQIFLRASR